MWEYEIYTDSSSWNISYVNGKPTLDLIIKEVVEFFLLAGERLEWTLWLTKMRLSKVELGLLPCFREGSHNLSTPMGVQGRYGCRGNEEGHSADKGKEDNVAVTRGRGQ
ncbi:hypothetical protein ACHAWF_012573 [Thalassiosira exigua]